MTDLVPMVARVLRNWRRRRVGSKNGGEGSPAGKFNVLRTGKFTALTTCGTWPTLVAVGWMTIFWRLRGIRRAPSARDFPSRRHARPELA